MVGDIGDAWARTETWIKHGCVAGALAVTAARLDAAHMG